MSQSSYDSLLGKLHEDYGEHIPKDIDDIIRRNREFLRLELASPEDMLTLQMPFIISNLRGNIEGGFIYKRVYPVFNKYTYFLIGRRVGKSLSSAVHTSAVIGYDRDNQVILTQSGSHYLINEFVAPDTFLLMNLCNRLHLEGLGSNYGVPSFIFHE